MKTWLILSLLVMCCWGVWGLLGKLASRTVSSQNLMLLSSFGFLIVFLLSIILFHKYFSFQFNNVDHWYAILGGFVGSAGGLILYFAISKGDASKVVCISAMYPALTVILSFAVLKEDITLYKVLGIMFALFGVFLLSK
ncbi:EamA family transporter [Desulfococcaceae bacterium HSG7]|nr:EamA family transporter [Desulfococcaceae bacterium HSG7]